MYPLPGPQNDQSMAIPAKTSTPSTTLLLYFLERNLKSVEKKITK